MHEDRGAATGQTPSLVGRALAAGGRSGRRLRNMLAPGASRNLPPWLARAGDRWLTPRGLALLAPALILGSGAATATAAHWLAGAHHRAAAARAPRAEPLIRAARAAAARTAALAEARATFEGPTITATLERLARDLPASAQIALLAREPDGRTRLTILTADPDRLRGSPALSGFRQLDQRRDDAGRIQVLLEARPR